MPLKFEYQVIEFKNFQLAFGRTNEDGNGKTNETSAGFGVECRGEGPARRPAQPGLHALLGAYVPR